MLDKVVEWHKKARPTPDDAAFNVQLGCHLEEVVEMLVVLSADEKNRTCSDTAFLLDDCTSYVGRLASRLKRGVATLSTTISKVSGAGTASAGLPGWQANGETE